MLVKTMRLYVHYIFIINKYFDKKREAQKWWLSKSLEFFSDSLKKFNISLEIISDDEIEIFSKIKKNDDVTIYWSKVYEPDVIKKVKKLEIYL